MPGEEFAPWEERSTRQPAQPAAGKAPAPKAYKPPKPDQLPEIYKPDDAGFIAGEGRTVARPAMEPRELEKLGKLALAVTGAAAVLGLGGALFMFLAMPSEVGFLRFIYTALPGVVGAAAVVVLLLELPRLGLYRTGSFMPGVLVYGTRDQFMKVAGAQGANAAQITQINGSGRGPLSLVFDRAAHVASPPEIVALHCDRGNGPELVGVAWDAVRELRRGDIVWFNLTSPGRAVMYHKLIPYAPRVLTDAAIRNEVFTALRVGEPMLQSSASGRDMGTKKVLALDRDGKVMTKPVQPEAPAAPGAPGIAPLGAPLGGADQPFQGSRDEAPTSEYQRPHSRDTEVGGIYRPPPKGD